MGGTLAQVVKKGVGEEEIFELRPEKCEEQGEACSRQRRQEVQRPGGCNEPGMLEQQKEEGVAGL